jgi:hypothetical protein
MIKIAFFIVILLYIETAYIVPSGLYFIVRSEGTPPPHDNTKVILSFREPKKKALPNVPRKTNYLYQEFFAAFSDRRSLSNARGTQYPVPA